MTLPKKTSATISPFFTSILRWFDSEVDKRSIKATDQKKVDWLRIVALIFLDLMCLGILGAALEHFASHLGTNGMQMLVWGFLISTPVLLHATVTINSFDHMCGRRRYNTQDTNRNNVLLALITLGEGWHNNRHHYAISARQGIFWWEIDMTYYLPVLMSWLSITRDLQGVPEQVLRRNRVDTGESVL
jgi:stearoyl-CoA desaturase (delta-9 desaturase)